MPSLSEEKSSAYLAQQSLLPLLPAPSSSVTVVATVHASETAARGVANDFVRGDKNDVKGITLNALINCDDDGRQLAVNANNINLFILTCNTVAMLVVV
jgi:hypothetical protein